MLKLHSALSKVPLFTNLVVKQEQLSEVSEPVQDMRLPTHFVIILKVCNVLQDALGDLLGQPACRWQNIITTTSWELSMELLA